MMLVCGLVKQIVLRRPQSQREILFDECTENQHFNIPLGNINFFIIYNMVCKCVIQVLKSSQNFKKLSEIGKCHSGLARLEISKIYACCPCSMRRKTTLTVLPVDWTLNLQLYIVSLSVVLLQTSVLGC
jgi:hypothetical protein